MTAAGGSAVTVVADLAKPEDCAAVVEAAVRAHGRIDVLFNNAGVGTMVVGGTVETIDLEHWDLAQDVNVRAMYLTSRAALPHLRAAGGGAIINTASVSAFVGRAERPTHAYAASKGAVLSLTRAMAVSFGRDKIRVNAICPGLIRTRLTRDIVGAAETQGRRASGHSHRPRRRARGHRPLRPLPRLRRRLLHHRDAHRRRRRGPGAGQLIARARGGRRRAANDYWGRAGLDRAIVDALTAAGKDLSALTIDDLAPADQFHGGGKPATERLARLAGLRPGLRVLDVGGGLGGPRARSRPSSAAPSPSSTSPSRT